MVLFLVRCAGGVLYEQLILLAHQLGGVVRSLALVDCPAADADADASPEASRVSLLT